MMPCVATPFVRCMSVITLLFFLPTSVEAWNFMPPPVMTFTVGAGDSSSGEDVAPPLLSEAQLNQLKNGVTQPDAESTPLKLLDESQLAALAKPSPATPASAPLQLAKAVPHAAQPALAPSTSERGSAQTETSTQESSKPQSALAVRLAKVDVDRVMAKVREYEGEAKEEAIQLARAFTVRKGQPTGHSAGYVVRSKKALEKAGQQAAIPSEAQAILTEAQGYANNGQLVDAWLAYIDVLESFPGTQEALQSEINLKNVEKSIAELANSEDMTAIEQNLPSFDALLTPEAKYHVTGFYMLRARMEKDKQDREGKLRDLRKVHEFAWNMMQEHPDSAIQADVVDLFYESAEETSMEAMFEAGAQLEQSIREWPPSLMRWRARSIVAQHMNFREYSQGSSAFQYSAVVHEAGEAYVQDYLADPMGFPWIKAIILCSVADAYYNIAQNDQALAWYERLLKEYPGSGWAYQMAGYSRAYLLDNMNRYQPETGIAAFQEYLDSQPDSAFAPRAVWALGSIYNRMQDFESAAYLFMEVVEKYPLSMEAEACQAMIQYYLRYGYLPQETVENTKQARASKPVAGAMCGPVALQRLLDMQGVSTTPEGLARLAGTTPEGTTMLGLMAAAKVKGVPLYGVQAEDNTWLPAPFIAHVKGDHYVLVSEVKDGRATIVDNTEPAVQAALPEFREEWHWNGRALVTMSATGLTLPLNEEILRGAKGGSMGSGGSGDTTIGGLLPECPNQNNECSDCSCESSLTSKAKGFKEEPCGGGSGGMKTASAASPRGGVPPWEEVHKGPRFPCSPQQVPHTPGGGYPSSLNPKANAQLGVAGLGATVTPFNAGMAVSTTDLSLKVHSSMPFSFTRVYHSRWGYHRWKYTLDGVPHGNVLGKNWTHSFHMQVEVSEVITKACGAQDKAIFYDEQGNANFFVYTDEVIAGTVTKDRYTRENPFTWDSTMIAYRDHSSGAYTVVRPDGVSYEFSAPAATLEHVARLTAIKDPNGNTFSMEYDNATVGVGKLTKVTAPTGDDRYYRLNYSGNLLSSVQLKKNTTVLKEVQYAYLNSELTKITDSAGDFKFEYGSSLHPDQVNHPGEYVGRYISKITDRGGAETTLDWTFWINTNNSVQAYAIEVTHPNGLVTLYDRERTTNYTSATVTNSYDATTLTQVKYVPGPHGLRPDSFVFNYAAGAANTHVWSYEYAGTRNDLTKIKRPNNQTFFTFTYTDNGQLSTAAPASGNGSEWDYSSTQYWSTKAIGPSGLYAEYTYDTKGNVVTMKRPELGTNGVRYEYNDYGQVTKAYDPAGNYTAYSYNTLGYLASVTSPENKVSQFWYDDMGRVLTKRDPNNQDTYYEYASSGCSCGGNAGQLTKVIDSLGNATQFEYDVNGNMVLQTDALNRETEYCFDAMHRLTKIIDPADHESTLEYNKLGQMTKRTDFEGRETLYEYDYMSRVTRVTDPVDDIQYTYTYSGRISTVTDGNGHETEYDYDLAERLTKVTDAVNKKTWYFYDAAGRVISTAAGSSGTTDPVLNTYSSTTGLLSQVSYVNGTVTKSVSYAYDTSGRVAQVDDWLGDASNPGHYFEYDKDGRITRYRDFDDVVGGTRHKLEYVYDYAGHVVTMTDYSGNNTIYTYTATGQVNTITGPGNKVWDIDYNALGQRTQVTLPNGMTTAYSYDGQNRLTKIEHKDGSTVKEGWVYSLDKNGNILRMASAVSGSAQAWDYSYDGRGRLVNAVRRNGSGAPKFRQSYVYDAGDNMLTKKTVPLETALVDDFTDGNCTANPVWTADAGSWSVDATGKYVQNATSGAASELRTAVTNSNGDYWFSYCIVNTAVTGARARMLFRSSYPTTVTFMLAVFYPGYMMLRQIVNSVDTTLYTNNSVSSASGTWYDVYIKAEGAHVEVWRGLMGQALGKIAETDSATVLTGPYVTLDVPANVQDRYDNVRYAGGLTTAQSWSDSFTDGEFYNNPTWVASSGTWAVQSGYLTKTGTADGTIYRGITTADYEATLKYRFQSGLAGRLIIKPRVVDNDNYIVLQIDTTQIELKNKVGGSWISLGTSTAATSTLGQWYDLYLRMDGSSVEVWRALSGQAKTLVLSTTQAGVLSSVKFALQEMANYYAQVDDVVMTVPDPVTTINQYNTANELTSQASGGVTTTFTYDDWGRLVTKNQGSYQARYGYRFGDKLKDVASNFPGEAATIYYQYDGLGKRRNKTLDLVNTTWWRWDLGWNVIQEYADPDDDWDIENLALTYIPGMAEVPGTNPATGSYRYYMGDHLGSVRTMRDQNKAALASYEYMPYGEIYNQTGLALNKGFTGHTWDKDDGLYYAPYRYYNPAASRWLTRDPLGMVDGPNLYEYVIDNPINYTDPSGGSLIGCGAAINWSLILRFRIKEQNRWKHCMVSCLLAKYCGQDFAEKAGWGKEWYDLIKCLLTNDSGACWSAFQKSDFLDNARGRSCPNDTTNCNDRCADLKGAPEAPSGPFGRLGSGTGID